MACLLPQRQLLGIRCQDPPLPLTSSRGQQDRRVFGAKLTRNNTYIYAKRLKYDSPLAYENDLKVVTTLQRIQQFNLKFGMGGIRRKSVSIESRIDPDRIWLDKLEATIDFYYINRRLPLPGEERSKLPVGEWLREQQYAKYCKDQGRPCDIKTTPERMAILESMLWWNSKEDAWQFKFEEVVEYVEKHGEIPPEDHPLGKWLDTQRRAYKTWEKSSKKKPKKGKYGRYYTSQAILQNNDHWERFEILKAVPGWSRAYNPWERIEILKSVPGWSRDSKEENWKANYQEVLKYVATYNIIPSTSHPTLGDWVKTQRHAFQAWQRRNRERVLMQPWARSVQNY
jgi:hypothetical protein